MTTIDIVIPVRNAARLLGPCLGSLRGQAAEQEARIIVVDDASEDGTREVAMAYGADVLRADGHQGPYAARNLGWRHGDARTVVFTDVRCRARPGWLAALARALEEPGVAVTGGDTWALSAERLAARFAHQRQLLRARDFLDDQHLPYLPTCNLATTRPVLEAVGGFADVRSGGDMGFCWRVQLAELGAVTYAPGADMDWVPRGTVQAVLSQWSRYGRARVETLARIEDLRLSPDPPPSWSTVARVTAGKLRDALRTDDRDLGAATVERLAWLAYWHAYHRAWHTWKRSVS